VIVGDGFEAAELTEGQVARLAELGQVCRGDILKMTTLAASGHPGGSMSSIDFELILWGFGNCDPKNPFHPERDRVVISHGHTSPSAYAALARLGWFDPSLPLLGFRRTGSPFEGHVERDVPGIDWGTGNLGQGLSAAVGFALAGKIKKSPAKVFCAMSDGEQQKGQTGEARRFAVRHDLTNIVGVLDWNDEQLSGSRRDILWHDIAGMWRADGWDVLEVDGHDVRALYQAVRQALRAGKPTVVGAHTVMSKGVPWMEKEGFKWHGAALPSDKCKEALKTLGLPDDLDHWVAERKKPAPKWTELLPHRPEEAVVFASTGTPRSYPADKQTDNRSAFGNALADLGTVSKEIGVPMAVLDCDLSVSTKTETILEKHPDLFFQGGIAEQNAAVVTGALSVAGVSAWWGEFAMFALAESWNAQRLNDVNGASAKVCVTHSGIDVGEDGKTHHSIDYYGLFGSAFGWQVFTPADPNQTDRIVRWMAAHRGNQALVMGRSKCPVVTREDGASDAPPLFAGGYVFDPSRADRVREGDDLAIVSTGHALPHALAGWKLLADEGSRVDLYSVASLFDLADGEVERMARHGLIVSVEDHNPRTGLGTQLQARLNELGIACRVRKLGVTRYSSSGPAKELYAAMGLDGPSIARAVREELALDTVPIS